VPASIPHDPRLGRRRKPSWVARVGRFAIDWWLFWSGAFGTLGAALASLFTPGKAAGTAMRRITLTQVFFTGAQGLPFVTITALVIGATIMIQTKAAAPGLPGEIAGKILATVVLREFAPLVTAIIVASRSGTAIATEIGNMKASLEVLGLSSMGIDPSRYVVLPRLVGVVASVLVLTVYFSVLAIAGSFLMAWVLGSPTISAMRLGLAETLGIGDLLLFLLKGIGCGILVGWLCCHFGLQVRSSTTEVPLMTGKAVIRAVLLCVLFNFAVTIGFYGIVGPPTH